ncbi:MAG: tetratricopeptide repeat protein [bacterium]
MSGEDVLDHLRDSWESSPGSLAFVPFAEALRRRGDLEEAIQVSRSGLDSRPNHSSAHLVLGRCLFDKGDFTEAIREFEEVVSLDPKNGLALRLLGLALKGKGWGKDDQPPPPIFAPPPAEMRQRGGQAGSVDEIEFFTRTMAEILERQGFYRKALEVYSRLLASFPDRADLRERIAALEQRMEREEAEGGPVA